MTGRRAESRLVGGIGTSREGRPAAGYGRGGPGGPAPPTRRGQVPGTKARRRLL